MFKLQSHADKVNCPSEKVKCGFPTREVWIPHTFEKSGFPTLVITVTKFHSKDNTQMFSYHVRFFKADSSKISANSTAFSELINEI